MTRAELFSAVRAETHRASVADELLATFLLSVEAKIARDVRASEQVASAKLTVANGAASLPADFLEARSVSNTDGPVQQVGLWEHRECSRGRSFTILGTELLGRGIDGDVSLDYFARMPALEGDSDTHALIAAHPDLYIALLAFHVYKWTQDAELAQGQLDIYADAAARVNELASRTMGGARIRRPYTFGFGGAY